MAAVETTVSIPSHDRDIPGVLALPADAESPVPAVLMLHGYGSSADDVGDMYGRLAESLAAEGIGSLRIDFAGMGASTASQLDYDYETQTTDAMIALDWLLGRTSVDPERVGVQSFSNGSFIGAHWVGTDDGRSRSAPGRAPSTTADPESYQASLAECEATGEGHIVVDLGFRTLDHSREYSSSY